MINWRPKIHIYFVNSRKFLFTADGKVKKDVGNTEDYLHEYYSYILYETYKDKKIEMICDDKIFINKVIHWIERFYECLNWRSLFIPQLKLFHDKVIPVYIK